MKKSLSLFILLATATLALAQGKLQFANDSQHLVYFATETFWLAPGDAGVAGKGAYTTTIGSLVGHPSLVVDLYAGPTSNSLTLQTTTTFGADEGKWIPVTVTFGSLPAGTAVWFQVHVHDWRDPNAAGSAAAGHYWGESVIFSAVPQPVPGYPICYAPAPVFSTWPPGTFQIIDMPPGNLGAIRLQAAIPDPPWIVYQPTNQMVLAGAPFSFSVTAAEVSSYQWRLNGTNLDGASGSVYTGFNAQLANAGSYTVVVTNSSGTRTSAVATLTVLLPATSASISQAAGAGVSINFPSVTGANYVLEYKNSLADSAWTTLAPTTTATSSVMALQDTNTPAATRYYRVRSQ